MKAQIFIFWTVLLGCSPAADPALCADERPDELGDPCTGDGECGTWLVCGDACELPAAVSGEGGVAVRLSDDGQPAQTLTVEVARGDLARSRGLNGRPCMAPGWGLLIDFPNVGDHKITTEMMQFPLDLAMVGEDGIIHTVHRDAEPGSKALYGAETPVRLVLETRAGDFSLKEGARLEYR